MGKNKRGKKRQREEKAKVKFKVGKTLPKGQNVTDLKFRTRKIVVPEQLKLPEEGAVLSLRKRKTLKELIAMLTSFNSKARQEALEGLTDISKTDFQEISLNSVSVLSKVAPVCSDKEPKVRKIAVKTLRDILSRSDLVHLRPSTHALAANLSSSMTHVVPEIRSDSLAFLDAILETHPSLLLSSASEEQRRRIFKDFLAQIAAPLKGEAGAKTSGIDWFVRVLTRLKLFVSGFSSSNAQNVEEKSTSMVFDRDRPIFACLDAAAFGRLPASEGTNIIPADFARSLAPLLVSVGTEVSGSDDTLSLEQAEAACCVAELLAMIISPLKSSGDEFGSKVAHAFRHFPYEVNPSAGVKKKGGKSKKSDQGEESEGAKLKAASVSIKLNLNLSHILVAFGVSGKHRRKIVEYVVGLLDDTTWIGLCSSTELKNAVSALVTSKDEVEVRKKVLTTLAKATSELHALKRERMDLSHMLATLYEEAYRNESVDGELRAWAKSTVELLEKDTVRPELFPLLVALCKLGDETLKSKMTKSLRLFLRGIASKTVHRTTWPEISKDLFHLLSWIRLELSPRDRSALLSAGCLTEAQLQCLKTAEMEEVAARAAHRLRWLSPPDELQSVMREFRSEFTSCDVTLICPRGETAPVVFKAHKAILTACSTFFKFVFGEVLTEGTSSPQGAVLIMTESRPEALRSLLDFIYNGQVFLEADKLGCFMELAEKLQLLGLLMVENSEVAETQPLVEKPKANRRRSADCELGPVPSKRFRRASGSSSAQQSGEGDDVMANPTGESSPVHVRWKIGGDEVDSDDDEVARLMYNDVRRDATVGLMNEPSVLPADVNPETIRRWPRDNRVFVGNRLEAAKDLYFCGLCDFQSPNAWNVQSHLLNHYPSRFICQVCDVSFSSLLQRRSHCAAAHGLVIDFALE